MSDFGDRAGAAVVTGGSGGIGAAIARLFAERGSDVAITYNRNLAAADKVVAEVEDFQPSTKAPAPTPSLVPMASMACWEPT